MLKRTIIILFVFLFIGCASGGTDCPKVNTSVMVQLPNGDIFYTILRKGELSEGALCMRNPFFNDDELNHGIMFSEDECQKLLEKYKAKKIKELQEQKILLEVK